MTITQLLAILQAMRLDAKIKLANGAEPVFFVESDGSLTIYSR